MNEAWVPIAGFEGMYEVSDLGRVRSLPRVDSRGARRAGTLLKPFRDGKKGYVAVSLCNTQKTLRRKVHQIVAAAFLSPRPDKCLPNHIDGDKANNAKSNLEWLTNRENVKHGFDVLGRKSSGGHLGKIGANNHNSLHVFARNMTPGERREFGCTGDAAALIGIHRSAISRCCSGHQASSKGWQFSYQDTAFEEWNPVRAAKLGIETMEFEA